MRVCAGESTDAVENSACESGGGGGLVMGVAARRVALCEHRRCGGPVAVAATSGVDECVGAVWEIVPLCPALGEGCACVLYAANERL